MKVLRPISTPQSLSIIPRDYSLVNGASLRIIQDGTRKSETVILSAVESANGNHIVITFSSTILTEGSMYFMEITNGSTLVYRDKIFCTSQTDKDTKHTLNSGDYEEHQSTPAGQKYIMR